VRIAEGGVPALEIAVPVESPPGSVAGALLLRSPLDDVAIRLDARLIDPDVIAFMVDIDGRVLSHPERDRVVRQERYEIAPLLESRSGTSVTGSRGDAVMSAAARTVTFPGVIVVQEPESSALASSVDTTTQLTLILLLAVIAIVAGVSLLGRSLLHPLTPLQEAVDALGRGALDQRVPVSGGKEVRALAADFNMMADRLQEDIDELASSEQRLHAILDNTTAVISLKDPNGRYLFVNRSFEERSGRSRDEVMGRTDEEIFANHVAAVARANDVAVMKSGAAMERQEVAEVDGERRTYLSVRFPLFDAAGEIYAVCGIATDITESKKVEDYERRLQDANRSRRQALAINDSIIQGLTVALYSLDLRRPADAERALEDTLASARSIMNDLFGESSDGWGPGDLVKPDRDQPDQGRSDQRTDRS
jgi:PAS domain S-box-containing protein